MDKPKKFTKYIYIALFVIFAAVFIVSAAVVVNYVIDSRKAQGQFDDLSNLRGEATDPSASIPVVTIPVPATSDPTGTSSDSTDPTDPPTKQILPEYVLTYLENTDLVGWITIPGTVIDYPVMQTPDNKDYYLHHDFYGNYSSHGCIYVREACDVQLPSDNLTIYGHHMKDGSMFAALMKYQKQSFWEQHKTFTFDTLTEHHTYEIFAVFKTSGTTGKGYPYHLFVNAESEADFDQFVADVKNMAFYDTGITAEYGDKLVCLSTCEYTQSNGRFVVVAKRIS